jgi:hypothetical protein
MVARYPRRANAGSSFGAGPQNIRPREEYWITFTSEEPAQPHFPEFYRDQSTGYCQIGVARDTTA